MITEFNMISFLDMIYKILIRHNYRIFGIKTLDKICSTISLQYSMENHAFVQSQCINDYYRAIPNMHLI
jgi:hypothetical protein